MRTLYGADQLAGLGDLLAVDLLRSFFPDVAGEPGRPIGLLGVPAPWRATRQARSWLLDRPPGGCPPDGPGGTYDLWIVVAEAADGPGVARLAVADLPRGPGSLVRLAEDDFVLCADGALADQLGRHGLREAALAVGTARDYLSHVTRWLAGRTSFGSRLSGHPVLRQRLALAVIELTAADAALRQRETDLDERCRIVTAAAVRCVRACQKVHAGAGVFDARPALVDEIYVRRIRGGRPAPHDVLPVSRRCPQLAAAMTRAGREVRTPAGTPVTGEVRQLVADLEQIRPVTRASLLDEMVIAESLAQALPFGLTCRALTHRQIVRSYLTGPGAAPAAAELLPEAAAGRMLTAIAVTEPQAGSDLAGLAAVLRDTGTGLELNAVKTYVTGGADCDLLLVAARRDQQIALVWVDAHRAQVERTPLPSRAWDPAGFARIRLRDCPLSPMSAHRAGGANALLTGLARERMVVAGLQLAYARRWLADIPGVLRAGLTDRLAAAQALLEEALPDGEPDEPSLASSSMAKVACCAVAADIADVRMTALAASRDGIDHLIGDQATARASAFAGGTADLNLAIVEGKFVSLFGAGNGARP